MNTNIQPITRAATIRSDSSTVTILTPADLDLYYQIANRNRCFSSQEIEYEILAAFEEMRALELDSAMGLAKWYEDFERENDHS